MTVAQTLPASRETVENSAAANASPSPTSASRNLTQTSAEADCSHCAIRPGAVHGDGGIRFQRIGVRRSHLIGA